VNWKHFSIRILLVAVAFPVFGALIFLLPHQRHLAFNATAVAVTTLGAFETAGLFKARRVRTSRWLAPLLAGTLPTAVYLETRAIIPPAAHGLWLAAAFAILLVGAILFQSSRGLPSLLSYAASSAFTLLYPALSVGFIVRMSSLPAPSLTIAFFLCLVFGNDMAAYFAGSMWGRSTCLHLPVSPQKSALGFAAGIAGSFIVVFAFRLIVPGFLGLSVAASIVLALVVGIAVILGDLLESGLKRSAGVKDSGVLIPGRGGILDSIDSMVLAAPLFYGFLLLVGRQGGA
jgi:phosphatidate cytidylyltransferase